MRYLRSRHLGSKIRCRKARDDFCNGNGLGTWRAGRHRIEVHVRGPSVLQRQQEMLKVTQGLGPNSGHSFGAVPERGKECL